MSDEHVSKIHSVLLKTLDFYLIKHNVIMVWLQSIDKFMAQLVNSRLSDWQLQWL